MIEKIATVMGIEFPYDPDETYVLTVDNLIKILAIQMRFRCGIPVVIMGETGCGKTRLIRYMCDLARQGEEKRNMLIMKVSILLSINTCRPLPILIAWHCVGIVNAQIDLTEVKCTALPLTLMPA